MKLPLFPLPPDVTRVILGRASSVDQQGMSLPTREMAQDFALGYGYFRVFEKEARDEVQ